MASTLAVGPTERPIRWVPGVKRPGRVADHSPPSSAEVKNTWSYTSTPVSGRRLGGSRNRSERGGEEKIAVPLPGIEPRLSSS
jgi:hypothetical protein